MHSGILFILHCANVYTVQVLQTDDIALQLNHSSEPITWKCSSVKNSQIFFNKL